MNRYTIGYATQEYVSHARAGAAYRSILSERGEIVTSVSTPDQLLSLDFIVLHIEPRSYAAIYAQYPELRRKYVISYCVWEATSLPASYEASLALVQEVWTCSDYCKSVIEKYHHHVRCIPHVIDRNIGYSEEDFRKVKEHIRVSDDEFVFLNISRINDRRKNVDGLIKAFQMSAGQMRGARLILKTPNETTIPHVADKRITVIPSYWSEGEINALYALSHVYVSAHHGEGWGYPLSDAMLMGKPTIATNYSGNLQFMNHRNSFLTEYEERNIESEDCYKEFSKEMRWAYPSPEDIASKLLFTWNNYSNKVVLERIEQARLDIMQFNRRAIAKALHRRVRELIAELGGG